VNGAEQCPVLPLRSCHPLVLIILLSACLQLLFSTGYAIPIFFRLINGSNTFKPGPVHLGRAGVPVAIIALLWVAFLTVLFVLPTAYPVTHINLNYAGVTVAGVLVLSIGWWVLSARKWFDGPNTA
jgi:hypothetical protein